MEVVIIKTGSANLASVMAAFARLGIGARLTDRAGEVTDAPLVVLPGVGAFGPAMATLRGNGLVDSIADRVERGRPLLAICLGMQLLCEASEESPGERGLGVVPGIVKRFAATLRVPQMGWNAIEPDEAAAVLEAATVYFANSYRLATVPPLSSGWATAMCCYGEQFVAGVERGPVLACQFHPELSGPAGRSLLQRWLAACGAGKVGVAC